MSRRTALSLLLAVLCSASTAARGDPLPSWNEGPSKAAIIDFVARLMGLVRHTDAGREYAYDRASHVGKLDKALDEALRRGWIVVAMKTEWKAMYAFDKP